MPTLLVFWIIPLLMSAWDGLLWLCGRPRKSERRQRAIVLERDERKA